MALEGQICLWFYSSESQSVMPIEILLSKTNTGHYYHTGPSTLLIACLLLSVVMLFLTCLVLLSLMLWMLGQHICTAYASRHRHSSACCCHPKHTSMILGCLCILMSLQTQLLPTCSGEAPLHGSKPVCWNAHWQAAFWASSAALCRQICRRAPG